MAAETVNTYTFNPAPLSVFSANGKKSKGKAKKASSTKSQKS